MELILLTGLLEALTNFIDDEEKLGFLQQDVVDKLIAVESMIDEVILGMTYKKDNTSSEILKSQELMYVPFLDEDTEDEFLHKNHHELEL